MASLSPIYWQNQSKVLPFKTGPPPPPSHSRPPPSFSLWGPTSVACACLSLSESLRLLSLSGLPFLILTSAAYYWDVMRMKTVAASARCQPGRHRPDRKGRTHTAGRIRSQKAAAPTTTMQEEDATFDIGLRPSLCVYVRYTVFSFLTYAQQPWRIISQHTTQVRQQLAAFLDRKFLMCVLLR